MRAAKAQTSLHVCGKSSEPYGAVTYQRIKVTDAKRTEKVQKMFIQCWKSSQWQ